MGRYLHYTLLILLHINYITIIHTKFFIYKKKLFTFFALLKTKSLGVSGELVWHTRVFKLVSEVFYLFYIFEVMVKSVPYFGIMYFYRRASKICVMFWDFDEVITMPCVSIINASKGFKVTIKNGRQAIREEVMHKSNYFLFDNIIDF